MILTEDLVESMKWSVGHHFYRYLSPRPFAEINAKIKQLEVEIQELLRKVAE